jgi:hypothetical protein
MSEIIKKDEEMRKIFQQVCKEMLIEKCREEGIFVYPNVVEECVKYLPLDELIPLILSSPLEKHKIIRERFNKMLLSEGYPSLGEIILLSQYGEEKKRRAKGERGIRITRSVKTYSEDLIIGVEDWDEREKPIKIKKEKKRFLSL